ncbi:MAG: trans-aconitate 2-methyltransferase [Planctomycetota bacterium]
MSASIWNPAQYERFKAEREQPFHDLAALVRRDRPVRRAVDLGCGTGELTRRLHESLDCAETTGVDLSETMLARAAAFARSGLRFERSSIQAFASQAPQGAYDLVFSNAALHWLDDHPALFAKLVRLLAPGGQLAVQMPAMHAFATHTLAAALAREAPFAVALHGYVGQTPVLEPEAYARLLYERGMREASVRLQVYGHELPDRAAVLEWVQGTTLTGYAERLAPDLFERFLKTYAERLLAALPDERPFFFPFKRILLAARKPS